MRDQVRVRFAPSPTGYVHVGSLRTALYNYLFARRHGGVFVLRIEDTDQTRYVPGAVEGLLEALQWAGLSYDEGPGVGGPHGPYLQSERLALYHAEVEKLLAAGHAYPCFCTPARLEEMRKAQEKAKAAVKYDRACLGLSAEEIQRRREAGEPMVIRMRVPSRETVVIPDLVRGDVSFDSEIIDDQVLLKSDRFPTYHLANVVDDHDMGITHVIRGEEWLPSTPKHVLLYRMFGWKAPHFAHLPLLLNTDRSKLSKRQGDVAVEDYRKGGYYPDALVNFVAFLGWNPGTEQEIFSLDGLVREFSLERVGKSGAIFNLEKLRWYNQSYIRLRSSEELLAEARPYLAERGWTGFADAYLIRVLQLMQERVWFVREYATAAAYFFEDPTDYDEETRAKRWTPSSAALLTRLIPALEATTDFAHDPIEATFKAFSESEAVKTGEIVHPVRLALSGLGKGPSLYEMMALLGRETCVRRLRRAIEVLG